MDYEKKYKEVLKKARGVLNDGTISNNTIAYIQDIFPELKESEKEQNIKDLIDELKCSLRAANCQNDACGGGHEKRIALLEWSIAWLEKQYELKWSEEDEMMCTIAINACEYANDEFESFNDNYEKAIMWLKSLKNLMKE